MEHDVLKELMNKEYYKSLSLAWAELAIFNYWLFYDQDDYDEKFYNVLLSHGQVVYHEFREDFERLWLKRFPDLSNIPWEITDDFICENCSKDCKNLADDIDNPF